MAAADFLDKIQKLYVAYYGRPADPAGLQFWANQADQSGVDGVVNAFGTSQEAQDLFGNGATSTFLNRIYQQMFGRGVDSEGLTYWTSRIDGTSSQPQITRAQAALAILEGAQNGNPLAGGTPDLTVINNKLAVANSFTAAIDQPQEVAAYNGFEAATTARSYLSGIDQNTIPANEDVDAQIARIVSGSTLTTGTDTLVGTGAANSYIADNSGPQPVLNSADSIDGQGGVDTLTIKGALGTAVPSIVNIENIVLDSSFSPLDANNAPASFNLSNTANALTSLTVQGAVGALRVTLPVQANLQSLNLSNIAFGNTNARPMVFDLTNSSQTSLVTTVNNVQLGNSPLTLNLSNVSVLTMTSTGVVSDLNNNLTLNSSAPIRLVLNGSSGLSVGRLNGSRVDTVDASALGGSLNIGVNPGLGGSGGTVIGSAFDDLIADSAFDDFLQGGAGNDRFIIAGGRDRIEGGVGTDSAAFATAITDATFQNANGQQTAFSLEAVSTTNAAASNVSLGRQANAAGIASVTTADNAASTVTLGAEFTNDVTINTGDLADVVAFGLGTVGNAQINTADSLTPSGVSLTPEALDTVNISAGSSPLVAMRLVVNEVGNGNVQASGGTNLAVAIQEQNQDGSLITGSTVRVDDEQVLFTLSSTALFDVRESFNTSVSLGRFSSVYLGGSGDDSSVVPTFTSSVFAAGGLGNDVITGSSQDDALVGGDGNDTLNGGDGADNIKGGSGNDVINGGTGDDALFDGLGEDVVVGADGNDAISLTVDGDRDVFAGLAGNDTIVLAAGRSQFDEIHFRSVDGTDTVTGMVFTGDVADFIALLDNGTTGGTGAVNFAASDSTAGAKGTRLTDADVTTSTTTGSYVEQTKAQLADAATLAKDNHIIKITDGKVSEVNAGLTFSGALKNVYMVVQNDSTVGSASGVALMFDADTSDAVGPSLVGVFTDATMAQISVGDFGVYTTV